MAINDEKNNLVNLAYVALKRDITEGVYRPGDKLLMRGLKERYEIGSGPMREALSRLVSEHLVTAISQRGFRVASMSIEELTDIYFARAHLEAMITELAVKLGDESWEAGVIASTHTLSKVAQLNSAEDMLGLWDARHKAFHLAIAQGCGSAKLLELRLTMLDQVERYRQLWLRHTVFSADALEAKREEHRQLVEVLLSRDHVKARDMMFEHMTGPVSIISEIIEARGLACQA